MDAVNYRLISITTSFSKILEKACTIKSQVLLSVRKYHGHFNLHFDVWYPQKMLSYFSLNQFNFKLIILVLFLPLYSIYRELSTHHHNKSL